MQHWRLVDWPGDRPAKCVGQQMASKWLQGIQGLWNCLETATNKQIAGRRWLNADVLALHHLLRRGYKMGPF